MCEDDGRWPGLCGVMRRSCTLRDGVTDLEAPTLSMLSSAVATLGAAMPKPRLPRLMWRMNFGLLGGEDDEDDDDVVVVVVVVVLESDLLDSMITLLRLVNDDDGGGGGTYDLSSPAR